MTNASGARYPISEGFKVLDGLDIYRSENLIVALVAVEAKYGKDLRLYRWQKRLDKKTGQHMWKVDLARMSVKNWDWDKIVTKVKEFKSKYAITAE